MEEFIDNFDFSNPDWENLPEGFFEFDPETLSTQNMIKYNSIKVIWEIYKPPQPQSRSRVWKSSNGYIYLASWSNASLLRILGVKWIQWLKDSKGNYRNLQDPSLVSIPSGGSPVNSSKILQHPVQSFGWKYIERLEAQLLDCLRSSVANQEEGYARPTTSEYLNFLGYAQGSLKEAKGDFQRSKQDGLLPSKPGSSLASIGIDLRGWHDALKKSIISKPTEYRSLQDVKGTYRSAPYKTPSSNILQSSAGPSKLQRSGVSMVSSSNVLQNPVKSFNYPSVDNLDPQCLTVEIFIELVNKTDWQLRRLVESLEIKLGQEQKFYKVEQARIRDKFRKK